MSYRRQPAPEMRSLAPRGRERTNELDGEVEIPHCRSNRALIGGCALIALAAVDCTGIVEDSALNAAAERDSGAAISSGIQPSAPTVPLPPDYRSWPIFLLGVQRTDNGQVRDLYVNRIGATAQQGQPFPEGTVLVMDLFEAQKDAAGTLVTASGAQLVKGKLLKTFVMGKSTGWGNYVSSDLRNGDWLYAAYASDGTTPTTDALPLCFSCHLPLGAKADWVQRYDDYFQQRARTTN